MSGGGAMRFAWEVLATGKHRPGPRSRHCLVYDSAAKATVLFGGIVWDDDGSLRADTWELRDGQWSRVECLTRPPARHRGAMTYDTIRRGSVLFGGQGR